MRGIGYGQQKFSNCGSENVEHLSRVTGYVQAVSGWKEGERQEMKDEERDGVGGMEGALMFRNIQEF